MARAVVALTEHPQPVVTIGVAPVFLKLAYSLFPSITRIITAAVIRSYIKKADAMEATSGNVLLPVEYGRGIDGGWRNANTSKPKLAGVVLLALAAGLLLFQRR